MSKQGQKGDLAHAQALSALFQAALAGEYVPFVRAIGEFDAQAASELKNVREQQGRSCLHYAAASGSADVCKLLLEDFGFAVDATDKAGALPRAGVLMPAAHGRPSTTP